MASTTAGYPYPGMVRRGAGPEALPGAAYTTPSNYWMADRQPPAYMPETPQTAQHSASYPYSPYAYGYSTPHFQPWYPPYLAPPIDPESVPGPEPEPVTEPVSPPPDKNAGKSKAAQVLKELEDLKHKDEFEQLTAAGNPDQQNSRFRKLQTIDYWKDTALRYFGIVNDVEDCWEDVIKHPRVFDKEMGQRVFKGAMAISWLYMLSDAVGNGLKTYKRAEGYPVKSKMIFGMAIVGDTIIFQSLASILAPILVVRGLQKVTRHVLEKVPALAKRMPKNSLPYVIIPALVSSSVVFMVPHIDTLVKKFIDITYWSWMNKWLKKNHAPEAPVLVKPENIHLPQLPQLSQLQKLSQWPQWPQLPVQKFFG